MTIRPFSGYLIGEPIKSSEVTKGGLFIPDISRGDLKSQFRVTSVGKGKIVKLKNGTFLRLAPEVKAGDVVIASTYAGKEVAVDGKLCRLMEQSSVQAVLEEAST